MAMMKKNESMKALTAFLAKNCRSEWELLNTNANRGRTVDQWELLQQFDRYGQNADGCSKAVHLLTYLAIKRMQYRPYIPEIRNDDGTGNQGIDEINCFKRYWNKPEADLLCPVFKYFTSKSDKVGACDKKMMHNLVYITQRAVYVSNARSCCQKAEQLNAEHGYKGERAERRYRKLESFSNSQNWRDAMYNPGNSGVIFDYYQNCYKAVFIDYAL